MRERRATTIQEYMAREALRKAEAAVHRARILCGSYITIQRTLG